MHFEHDETGEGYEVYTPLSESDAEALREDQSGGSLTVTIGNIDLPALISNGQLYIQAPLPLVFEAFAEDLREFLRDMEVRISDKRGRSLSLDSDGRAIYRAQMVGTRMVRSRWLGR